jgi:hypothetical protein
MEVASISEIVNEPTWHKKTQKRATFILAAVRT